MNATTAVCGHTVIAVGAPGSIVRAQIENRHCGRARCEAQLPDKFTDRECEAYVWLRRQKVVNWLVDMKDKTVLLAKEGKPEKWVNLISLAQHYGWQG